MTRTVRNARLDTRSARARLPAKKSGYWVPITRGFALGYRKGPKGGVWLARLIDSRSRREATLGSADDALDADGERVLDYAQAQANARDWLASLDAEGKAGPYTIDRGLDDYKRRGGKALDRLEITGDAFIRPQLGAHEVDSLTPAMIREWHAAPAEEPARLRTRSTSKRPTLSPRVLCQASEHDLEAAIASENASCPLSETEITNWVTRLGSPGPDGERRLRLLVTYWYARAADLLSIPEWDRNARVRDYVRRRLSQGHSPEEIVFPSYFDRVDQWLPEIGARLMAIRSELLCLPGDVDAELRTRFLDYEKATDFLGALAQALNNVAEIWHRPGPGQPSLEWESLIIDVLVCAVEEFTNETFRSPYSDKRMDQIEIVRVLADRLLPPSKRSKIDTMFNHFHQRRLAEARATRI